MTKEEAIRILASSCIPGSKQTEALETLIPELRESEDERIRKAIYDFFSLAGNAYDLYGIPKANLLAYLEKQKDEEGYEAIPVESTLEYKLGFKAGRDPEKQKEQKPSINIDQLKSLMLQYLQEAANEKDDLDIEADTDKWARKILGYDFEQKPADLSEMMVHKEPYIAPVPTPMVADEQKSVKYGDDVVEEAEEYTSKVDCGEYGAEVTEAYIAGVLAERNRKPADYEAELKKCKDNPLYFYDKYVSIKLKPAKWNEEEYGRLFDIEHYLDGTLQLSPDRRIACIDFLKSLRPHWKPSEEQMGALFDIIHPADTVNRSALISLYEQLKKL